MRRRVTLLVIAVPMYGAWVYLPFCAIADTIASGSVSERPKVQHSKCCVR